MGTQLTLIVVEAPSANPALQEHWRIKVPRGILVWPVLNVARHSLAKIGNDYLDKIEAPVFGICHADCTFGEGSLEVFAKTALDGNVCGIVGIDLDRHYRWCHTLLTTQYPDGAIEDVPGPVSTLDSCSVFFRRDSGLRFDEKTFDGFHCHVEDLCLQAQQKGIPVVVPPANATHLGANTFNPQWQADCAKYRSRLAAKWHGVRYEAT